MYVVFCETLFNLILCIFHAIDMSTQVHHQQVALVFKYTTLFLQASTTVHSHIGGGGGSGLKDITQYYWSVISGNVSICMHHELSLCIECRVIIHDVCTECERVGFTTLFFTLQGVWMRQFLLITLYSFNIILM
jgi:hypothetical protein